jgi:hypothetical protein
MMSRDCVLNRIALATCYQSSALRRRHIDLYDVPVLNANVSSFQGKAEFSRTSSHKSVSSSSGFGPAACHQQSRMYGKALGSQTLVDGV